MTTMMLAPLKRTRDYEAAVDRLGELEELEDRADDDAPDDVEVEDEAEALETLIDDYEAREGAGEEDEDDFELAPRLPVAEPVAAARFRLSNGNLVAFLCEAYGPEVAVVEATEAGSEDLILSDGAGPAALFARLAPKHCPAPRALVRLDQTGMLEDRKVVDALDDEMEIDLARLGVAPAPAAAAQTGSCAPDPAGAAYFEAHHCNTGGGPGYGKSESYCFAGAYAWIQKTSGRRRATYSRMVGCGSGTCRLRHYYKKVSGYHTQLLFDVQAPGFVHFWTYKKGIKRKRRVRFEALGAGGKVRGWVRFHSQVADISV